MVYGIGEIGLDKLKINKTPFDVQLAYFEKLISLASTLKKPVMLHIVRAWDEAKKILAEYPIPAIYFHGFYGKIEFLKELLAAGINVSLNPKMLEREELYNFLRENPNYIEKIKLETDDKNLDIKNLYSKLYEGIKNDR
jgi:TatD DNase family protein